MQQLGVGNGSHVTVRIDGGFPAGGAVGPGWDLIFGDVGVNGATDQGQWVTAPTQVGNTIEAVWRTLPGSDTFLIPSVEVKLVISIVHDQAAFQFTVTDLDTAAHSVGLRFAQDVNIQGSIVTPTLGTINNEIDLNTTAIPPSWRVTNSTDLTDLTALLSAGGTLTPQPGGTTPTRPERVVFARAATILPNLWDVTITGSADFTSSTQNAAAAVFFNPSLYSPSQSRTITTYFGRQVATTTYGQRLAAAVDAPFAVKFDGTKPAGSQFTPDPINVTASIVNQNVITVTNVKVTLSLPAGLIFADGQTAQKTIASIAPGAEGSVSWQVKPDLSIPRFGKLVMSVAATADPGGQSISVNRDIELPPSPGAATPFPSGIQMVSFPFVFDDPTPTVALGLSAIDFDLIRWNSTLNVYEAVRLITPGEGYWLRLPRSTSITFTGAHPVNITSPQFEVKLAKDWNQISSPYAYRVVWGDVRVINTDIGDPDFLRPITLEEASSGLRQWILPTLYRYNPDTGAYEFDQDFSTPMEPFKGYWVKALRPNISLLIPAANGGRSAKTLSRSSMAASQTPTDWQMRLVATSGRKQDSFNYFGVAPVTQGGLPRSVEEPPVADGALRLTFVRNVGSRAVNFASDVQPNTFGRKEWQVQLSSPQPNMDVTLSWPDMQKLPRGYELVFTDQMTGARHTMRQVSSINVNTGDKAQRTFKITAEPRNVAGVFRITSASVIGRGARGAGSATIAVTGTTDATYTVRIVGTNGQQLRNLVTRAGTAGTATTVTWDYKDGRGISVPSGVYTVEVKGATADGQSARFTTQHIVTR
jgi:hypothetical protein